MKKFLSVFLVFSLLWAVFASAAYADTQYAMCSTPTSDGTVYVRAGAGTSYGVMGVACNGDTLIVLTKGTTWHRVKVIRTGIEGWMSGTYIKFLGYVVSPETSTTPDDTPYTGYMPDASAADKDTVINKYGTISSSDGYANLRWGPSTSFASMAKIYNNTQVAVLEQNGSWYRCEAGSGRIGYINKNLVKLTDSVIYSAYGLTGVVRSSDGYATVRSGAGTNYNALYTINAGNAITAYGTEGDWLRISNYSSWNAAYVYRTLVRFYSAATVSGNVNLRKGPTTSYDIIRTLSTGTKVTLLATDGNFCRVDTGKEIAYVSNKYLNY